jgi:chromosomal replication initiator protein
MSASTSEILTLWPTVLERLRPAHGKAVDVWLDPNKVQPVDLVDGVLTLECPNPLFSYTLSNRLAPAIAAAVGDLTGSAVQQVRGHVTGNALREHERRKREASGPGTVAAPQAPAAAAPQARGSSWGHGFKLLGNFVVGSANRLAYDAMQHLLDHPDSGVNPVFIHGKSGLGKTHLEQGLALAFKERYPSAKVLYMRCEQFTNEWLAALGGGPKAINAFRVKMRHADLLLVDDIHFLSQGAKPNTTNELFATFNALSEQGKKVVFTSDAGPRDIQYLEDSFVGRFLGGLVVELQKPDAALRREVVRAKALAQGVTLQEPVIEYVGEHIIDNIRELEGAVNKLVSYARSFQREVDLVLARQALADLIERNPGETLTQLVLREVADHYGVNVKDLLGKGRAGPLSTARHVAMYVLKLATGGSYAAVGREFGAGHTNVIYACDQVKKYRTQDKPLDDFLADLLLRAKRG